MARFSNTEEGRAAFERSSYGEKTRESAREARETGTRERERRETGGSIASGFSGKEFVKKGTKRMKARPEEARKITQDVVSAVLSGKSDKDKSDLISLFNQSETAQPLDSIIGALAGIKSKTAIKPDGEVGTQYSKTVSPMAIALGLAGGPIGMALGAAAGDIDPFAFDIDLGFGGSLAPTDRDKFKQERETGGDNLAIAETPGKKAKGKKKSADDEYKITDAQKVLEQAFGFAQMPQFNLLPDTFGTLSSTIPLGDLVKGVK